MIVTDAAGDVLLIATTNFLGQYTIQQLPAGDFYVQVIADGYAPAQPVALSLQAGELATGVNVSLAPAGVDGGFLEQLNAFQAAANGFSGFLLSGFISQLNPGNLPNPASLPTGQSVVSPVTDDILNHSACPSETAALNNFLNVEQSLESDYRTYQNDFSALSDGMGSALNTFLQNLGNVALALLPEVNNLEAALAAEVNGATQTSLAAEKFFASVKPAFDSAVTASNNMLNMAISPPPSGPNAALDTYNALITNADTIINALSPLVTLGQTLASAVKALPVVSAALSVASTVIELGQGTAAVNALITKVEGDQQLYASDLSAFYAALNGLTNAHANCHNPPPPPPPPPPPHPKPAGHATTNPVRAMDPNEIIGPAGVGSQGFIQPFGPMLYSVDFTNESTATAPAQVVTVTDQLSSNLDWNTFQLGEIGFGSTVIQVPAGLTTYSTQVNATATLGVLVNVSASLDLSTGMVTWTFTSIDPNTLDIPANPLLGFLPPDNATGVGEGFASYTVQHNSIDTTGTVISAVATVVFDTNAPLNTATIFNTIDDTTPSSTVNPLPATTTSTSFPVSWSGSDGAGSGIATYNVYVSDDGGAFQPFQTNTTATSATFTGQVGHTYGFYTVATSNVGLVQPTPSAAQATIAVIASTPPPPPAPPPPPPFVTMTNVQTVIKKHQVTEVIITFSGAVNAVEADETGLYRLATPGKRGSYTAKNAGIIKLKKAAYSSANNTVTLTPKKPFALTKPVQLVVNGTSPAGLQDTLGRFIDGGESAVAILSRKGATIDALTLSLDDVRKILKPSVVDALLEQPEASIARHWARGEHFVSTRWWDVLPQRHEPRVRSIPPRKN